MLNIQVPYYTLYKLHYGGSREARDTKQKLGGHGAKRRSPERYDLSRERIFHNRRRAFQTIPRVGQFSLYKSKYKSKQKTHLTRLQLLGVLSAPL